MPTRANDGEYSFTWKQITRSSRSMTGVRKGQATTVKSVKKQRSRDEIMAELNKLGYKLPGVND